jgi:glycosidase
MEDNKTDVDGFRVDVVRLIRASEILRLFVKRQNMKNTNKRKKIKITYNTENITPIHKITDKKREYLEIF